jgi:hypothetical protein
VAAAVTEYLDRLDRTGNDGGRLKMDEIDIRILEEILKKEGRDE